MKPYHWIILALVLVIIGLILFDRDKGIDPDKKAYQDTVSFLRRSNAEIRASGTKIISKAEDRAKKDSIKLRSQDKEIKALKTKASQQRVKVITKIEEDPDLKSFVETQDQVIEELQVQNDTLRASVSFHIQTQKDLIQNFEAERSISQRIEQEQENRIENLEKQNRREKRKVKIWKVATVLGTVGAFLLAQ